MTPSSTVRVEILADDLSTLRAELVRMLRQIGDGPGEPSSARPNGPPGSPPSLAAKRGRKPRVAPTAEAAGEADPEANGLGTESEETETEQFPDDVEEETETAVAVSADASKDFDEALKQLRELFNAPGGGPEVKALQRIYGVAKFGDVPRERGTDLLAQARKIAAKLKAAKPKK